MLQVAEIAANHEMIETFDLSLIMSRLNLGWTPTFPSYEEVFPSQWANNQEVELRHREIMQRIQNWPYDGNNEVRSLITSITAERASSRYICLFFTLYFSVRSEDAAPGLSHDPLQHGLRDPQEEGDSRESSIEIQFTSSEILEES